MNLQKRIESYLEKKSLNENVTYESSKKEYEKILNSIKSLKGQVYQIQKNVDNEMLTGLTKELKKILADIENKVKKD